MDDSQPLMDDPQSRTRSYPIPADDAFGDSPPQAEQAAGGLVWRPTPGGPTVAVVHRPRYGDWTLPKGRPAPGESLPAAARREAQEETGVRVSLGPLAGAYSYETGDRLKVVLVWHMDASEVPWEDPATQEEVDEVAWLPPVEAMERLTHSAEREFVSVHALGLIKATDPPKKASGAIDPEMDRLSAAVSSVRVSLSGLVAAGGGSGWWTPLARDSLAAAEAALLRGKVDMAWGALHDCERFMVYGLPHPHLLARAVTLRAETKATLTGWRRAAALRLLPPEGDAGDGDSDDPRSDRPQGNSGNRRSGERPAPSSADEIGLQERVVEALSLLHDQHHNVFHRVRVVRRQLVLLMRVTGGLLVAAFLLSLAAWDTPLGPAPLAAVALAGALGAVLSGLYHQSQGGRHRIAEGQLDSIVSVGRPAIGAVAALFLYALLKSGFINLIDPVSVTLFHGVALGFIAGFSEHFVLSTAARVSGRGDERGDRRKGTGRRDE